MGRPSAGQRAAPPPGSTRVLGSARPLGLAAWSGRTQGMRQAHRHSDLEINYVLAGTMRYLVGGSVVTLPRRRLCVLWAAAPHQTLPPPDAPAHVIWVTVPLGQALAWGLPETLVRRLLRECLVIEAKARPGDLALLRQWEQDLGRGGEAPREVLLEIEARLRRLASNLSRASVASMARGSLPRGDALEAVQQMARFIAEHYAQEIQVSDIARAAALHPNYAMTLFRQQTGMTLVDYLTRQRIAHTQRLLATTREPILQIAFDAGFGSASRFYEAFRQHAACTPRQFRANLAATRAAAGT